MGDLAGLSERVDYLAGIGVSCLWLMPFHPSPNRDDGYDITDYYGVDDRLGTLGDFAAFIRTAKDRGHAGDHRPRRQPHVGPAPVVPAARAPRRTRRSATTTSGSTNRRQQKKSDVVFPDAEDSIWARDEKAGQWYLHHFYSHQPDLNISNPAVRDEIAKIAGFWLELGVDGFRVDAVPFLLEAGAIPGDVDLDPHDFLRGPAFVRGRRNGDAVLLGEVNLPAEAAAGVLRRPGRRGAAALQLPGDGVDVPVAGAPGRTAARAARSRGRPQIEDCAIRELRAEPRRADPRPAERQGAPGRVRCLRPGPGHAALRPGSAPTAAADARRRPATDPHGLQPAVLPARHAGAVLRRGDRHGREPRRSRAAQRALADAVDRRQNGGFSHARAFAARSPRHRRPLRTDGRQRRRPATRPRFAAELDGAHDPAAARDAGDRVGQLAGARAPIRRRCSPIGAIGKAAHSWPSTIWRATPARAGCTWLRSAPGSHA